MEPPSHHELLCVTPDATADEIRASYRRLIRIYHPDVAGAAGAAMTLRLNEAQEALLNPGAARSSTGRPSASKPTPRSTSRSSSRSSSNFQREWAYAESGAHQTRASRPRPAASKPRTSAEWMIVAIVAITVIVASTIAVLAFTYSGPIGVTPRILPAIVMALVWMAGGLSRPPMITFLLLGFGILLWPLAASNVQPFVGLATAIPTFVWALLTLSFVAVVVLRTASPRAAWPRRSRMA
jgi:hypothetical protein